LSAQDATRRIRAAIRTRYALLPYLYTLFHAAHAEGLPIMRPLAFEFPGEGWALGVDDAFLLGPALLVAPVLEPGAAERRLRLPAPGPWYSAASGEAAPPGKRALAVGMDDVPAFLRGGCILPLKARASAAAPCAGSQCARSRARRWCAWCGALRRLPRALRRSARGGARRRWRPTR
jgi:alpha 1,3-glucosidase